MSLATCLRFMTVLYASQDTSVSQVTGPVWTTEFHFTELDRIVYVRNRDNTHLEVDTTFCAVGIRLFGVKCSSYKF